jgi:hypothetical protein
MLFLQDLFQYFLPTGRFANFSCNILVGLCYIFPSYIARTDYQKRHCLNYPHNTEETGGLLS